MTKPEPPIGSPLRDERSRLVGLLGCAAIVIASLAAVIVWTALTQPLALVEALSRGGLSELVAFLVADLVERVAELARFVW